MPSDNWPCAQSSATYFVLIGRRSTSLSVLKNSVLCRWYAGERSSPVVDLQSAGCPTVTPRYCCWPFICHSCMSHGLERSSRKCRVCHIFTDISSKTKSTYISTILPGHYFVTVSWRSGPCGFFTRAIITIAECNVIIVMTGCRRRNDVAQLQFMRHEHSHWNRQTCSE